MLLRYVVLPSGWLDSKAWRSIATSPTLPGHLQTADKRTVPSFRVDVFDITTVRQVRTRTCRCTCWFWFQCLRCLRVFSPPIPWHCVRSSTDSVVWGHQGDFTVKPSAMAFLHRNGLDLNHVFTKGVKYVSRTHKAVLDKRAAALAKKRQRYAARQARSAAGVGGKEPTAKSDGVTEGKKEEEARDVKPTLSLDGVWKELCALRKPLVVHNGLLDLTFLYEAFSGTLPSDLRVFVARLLVRTVHVAMQYQRVFPYTCCAGHVSVCVRHEAHRRVVST